MSKSYKIKLAVTTQLLPLTATAPKKAQNNRFIQYLNVGMHQVYHDYRKAIIQREK